MKDLDRAARAIHDFLAAIGAPPDDVELRETGRRVAEAFANELLVGYDMDPREILADATAATSEGLVVVTGIETTTTCPHHLMPAMGVAHVGYLPGGRVVGLGAIARLVDCYAHRFALQETLGDDIARALVEHLGARGAGCVLSLSPTCLTSRGERRHGSVAVTHAWAGVMANDTALRAELLSAVRLGRELRDHSAV